MSDAANTLTGGIGDEDVETALLDADLFLKYQAPDRAVRRLQFAIESHPRSIPLRERLREIAVANKIPHEAARQCLALAGLYLQREDFDLAHDRLLEARQLDPRISITSGLEAVRRARRGQRGETPVSSNVVEPQVVSNAARRAPLAGDLSVVSIFDAVQVVENARLTGAIKLSGGEHEGKILFNEGQIVDAETSNAKALEAFSQLINGAGGYFEFELAGEPFPVNISSASNTNLILEVLRQIDEENA